MKNLEEKVQSLEEELIGHRRYFHSHPESGWLTFLTTAKIAKILSDYGYSLKMGHEIVDASKRLGLGTKEQATEAIKRAEKLLSEEEKTFLPVMEDGLTGVVAEIDTNKEGPCLAFRFDIDAVDVSESKDETHLPTKNNFSSDIEGIMHACGHDGHISIGLGLAKLICENIESFKGKFKFIFQTGEEGCRGAVGMEPTGILDNVDFLFGAHIGFQAKKDKSIICGVNKFLATSKFDVTFKGKSAHAAGEPENGANALLAAAQAAISMHAITRHSEGTTRINVGVLKAGEGRNVIAPNAYMACETRGETTDLNEFMKSKCMDIIEGVSKIHSVSYEIKETGGTAGGDSSEEVTELFYSVAKDSPFINDELITRNLDFGACEDYAHFMRTVQINGGQSGYAMIGTQLAAGHHNECFDFNESCLVGGLDVFLKIAYKLNKIDN